MSVECQWTWEFGAGHAHLVGRLSGVKYVFYRMLELQAGSKPGQFILLATIDHAPDVDVDLTPQRFVGMIENGSLVLAAEKNILKAITIPTGFHCRSSRMAIGWPFLMTNTRAEVL